MQKVTDVRTAVEGLYQAFSIYLRPEYTDPCLHCHSLDDDLKLRSSPLRDLSVSDLEDYAQDALLVWGSVNHFRYFLPRIFELYFHQSGPRFAYLDPEILFSKFRHGHWLDWPAEEQTAVRELLHAIWAKILDYPPASLSLTDLQSWICSIAQAEDDLNPYLRAWISDQRLSASLALASLLLSQSGRNPFWDGREAQYAQLQSWLESKTVVEKLQRALQLAESHSDKSQFEAALRTIGASRS